MYVTLVIIAIVTFLTSIYIKLKRINKYWTKLNVIHEKPIIFFGNSLPIFLKKSSLSDICYNYYFKYDNVKMIGLYDFITPTLIIKDPYLIEKILIKDFHHFTDHSIDNKSGDLFSYSLFQMTGNNWKSVRHKMIPTFTSAKLKLMFEHMLTCSDELIKMIRINSGKDYEIKTALSKYSLDIIANIVFSVQFNDNEKKEEFINMCASIFDTKPLQFLHLFLLLHLPKLANMIGITFASEKVDKYFRSIIKEAFEQRINNNKSNIERNDYVQLLLKLKKQGKIDIENRDVDDEYLNLDSTSGVSNIEITDDLLAGQAFQFLTAGLDPVYSCMLYTLYEIAKNAQILERVRQEIKLIKEKNYGFTYQAIKEMLYLEQCVQESLRLYPIAPVLFRQCTKSYITDDGIEIEKGLKLIIPIIALHMDPNYYPNPEIFNPDRFSPDLKPKTLTYLPFGNGPRICLGFRFAMIVIKLGLAKIIDNFNFKLCPDTAEKLEFNKLAFLKITTNQILFNFSEICDT